MNEDIVKRILMNAVDLMFDEDASLAQNNDESNSLGRKLHEVCLNHCLAYKLKMELSNTEDADLFVDIEFNRNGLHPKHLIGQGCVRPDIIIHNRKFDREKANILVIEAKKSHRSDEDENVIKAFMDDPEYEYQYGAHIVYHELSARTTEIYFFSRENGSISRTRLLLDNNNPGVHIER